jgi:hypothetical protein
MPDRRWTETCLSVLVHEKLVGVVFLHFNWSFVLNHWPQDVTGWSRVVIVSELCWGAEMRCDSHPQSTTSSYFGDRARRFPDLTLLVPQPFVHFSLSAGIFDLTAIDLSTDSSRTHAGELRSISAP